MRSFWMVGVVLIAAGCQAQEATPSPRTALASEARVQEAKLEKEWGVKVESLRLTAAGHMLDFRFRVTDAEKARPLIRRQTKSYAIDLATGKTLPVPNIGKIGQLRSSTNDPSGGSVYFVFFANPGQQVKPGSKVAVVIGDFKADNLTVE